MQKYIQRPFLGSFLRWICAFCACSLLGFTTLPDFDHLPSRSTTASFSQPSISQIPQPIASIFSPSFSQDHIIEKHLSILVANHTSYYKAYQSGMRWLYYWQGEVWLEEEMNGTFSLILYRPGRRDATLQYFESLRRSQIPCRLIRYAPRKNASLQVIKSMRGSSDLTTPQIKQHTHSQVIVKQL